MYSVVYSTDGCLGGSAVQTLLAVYSRYPLVPFDEARPPSKSLDDWLLLGWVRGPHTACCLFRVPTNSIRRSTVPPQNPCLSVGCRFGFRQDTNPVPKKLDSGWCLTNPENKKTRCASCSLTSLTPALTASCVASAVCFFTAAYGSFPLCIHPKLMVCAIASSSYTGYGQATICDTQRGGRVSSRAEDCFIYV